MIGWDLANAVFEAVSAVLVWQNVRTLRQHRLIRGVDWRVQGFFAAWGIFNVVFYGPVLGLWASWAAGLVLCAGNLTWVALAIRYRKE